jgi:hypothetical protein
MTWYAGDNSTNNGSLGWVFAAPGGTNVDVNVTGVTATGNVGSVTVETSTDVSVTGVSTTGLVGDVAVAGSANVNVTGVAATGQVGDVLVVQDATAYVYSFQTASITTALVQAAANVNPGKALFKDTTIGGRPLGDINNTGTVTSSDALSYLRWVEQRSTAVPADNVYIETVMNAYMTQNPAAYAAYLAFGYGLV